jgi:CubicO group peptidase (beta-lactamase class C family)
VAEFVAPALAAEGPDLRSATKSITALLAGIALDRQLLPSTEARVVDLLPELGPFAADDPRKAAMTFEDLLAMRSGLDCDDWNPKSPGHEDRMYRKGDWIEFWATRPMHAAPGSAFSYCTGNAVAVGRILARATGVPVDRFAEESLFAPLGIRSARWERWNRDRDVDSGGHLRLDPRDLARIGEMVANGGELDGRRIVSASWIERMTAERSEIPGRPQRYGLLWWLDRTTRPELPSTRLWMAWGNGGNFLVVLPELGAVVVFTGTRFNRPEALEPLGWLASRLLPAWKSAPPSAGAL